MSRLGQLLQDNTAGDPAAHRSKLWTGKRLNQLSRELRQFNIQVSPNTVGRLLDQLGYGLHANSKSISVTCAERDQQFGCIARHKKRFLRFGQPVISVDTKKNCILNSDDCSAAPPDRPRKPERKGRGAG